MTEERQVEADSAAGDEQETQEIAEEAETAGAQMESDTVSDETVSDETVSDETVSDETVSDETVSDETVSDDSMIEDNAVESLTDENTPSEEVADEALSPEDQLIQQLEADLAEAQAEALSQIDKQQRLAAEFQNSKKRQERQLSDAIRRASEGVVTRLLPVLDDFELAFSNMPEGIGEEEQSWVEGFQQIQIKLTTILDDQGLTAIPRDGEFDPNLHEAITSEPSDDVEAGHIIETLRVGYEFKGRVLRPAMVRVAS